jgi:D-ribose pyranose/furanose isomerase RbsD
MNKNTIKENKLAYIKMNIDKLSAEIDKMEANSKKSFPGDLRLLKEKRNNAVEQYETLKQASGNAFETVRAGMLTAWRELAGSVERAKNIFHNSL